MPRTTREYALRYADHAINDMDRTLENLQKLADLYPEDHPTYSKYKAGFEVIASMIMQAKEFTETMRNNFM